MPDLDKDYPTRTFRHSVWSLYLAAAIALVVAQQFLTQVIITVADFFGGLPQYLRAGVALALLAILAFVTFRLLSRMRFDQPVLTISTEGLSAPAAGFQPISWNAISKVTLERTGQYRLNKWIVLTPKDDLDPEMQARFSGPNFSQREASGLYIALGFLEGTTSTELLDVVRRYHAAFRGNQDEDASIKNLGFHASSWTGVVD